MAILNTNAPSYKTVTTNMTTLQPAPSASGLSGLFGSLLGNATPAYKSVGGQGAQAPASSGGLFGLYAPAPSYKTAPAVAPSVDDTDATDVDDSGCPVADGSDDTSELDVRDADQIVVL